MDRVFIFEQLSFDLAKNINIDLLPSPSPGEIMEANNIFELLAVLARASRGPQARYYS